VDRPDFAGTVLRLLEDRRLHDACGRSALAHVADPVGITLLHYAAFKGDAALCRALLLHGADPRRSNKLGETPIDDAEASNQPNVVAVLRDESIPDGNLNLTEGVRVRVRGLTRAWGYNGLAGTLGPTVGERVKVIIDKRDGSQKDLAVRPANLQRIPDRFMVPPTRDRPYGVPVRVCCQMDHFGKASCGLYYSDHCGLEALQPIADFALGPGSNPQDLVGEGDDGAMAWAMVTTPAHDEEQRLRLGPFDAVFNMEEYANEVLALQRAGVVTFLPGRCYDFGAGSYYQPHPVGRIELPMVVPPPPQEEEELGLGLGLD